MYIPKLLTLIESGNIKLLVEHHIPTLPCQTMADNTNNFIGTRSWCFVMVAICLNLFAVSSTVTHAADSAVIFMYHRFGEQRFPSTNVSVEQLDEHIKELVSADYNVLPLPVIVSALRNNLALPDRAIGISIDDAFSSAYHVGWPKFKASGLPFTLFVSTKSIDERGPSYMSWEQIRELKDSGVTIGNQTHSHTHMTANSIFQNQEDINISKRRFIDELGDVPTLFAYPFGEMSLNVRKTIIKSGFIAAFGQHSGVAHSSSDQYFLPRFALNETYGGLDRLFTAANAKALPVFNITPSDPLLTDNPPAFGFSVSSTIRNLKQLSCYNAQQGRLKIELLGSSRIEVRFANELPSGRSRINCTVPVGDGTWRWYGRQFLVPKD